jgi:hypothetical protein
MAEAAHTIGLCSQTLVGSSAAICFPWMC